MNGSAPEKFVSAGIVVPTFNGARYLRKCVDSILAQGYANLRCIVMDGGSRDGSVEILESYGSRIEFVSEPDRGQADAIRKGFQRLGNVDIVGWLNSDDCLLPGALASVVEHAQANPDAVLFHGDLETVDEHGTHVRRNASVDLDWEILRSARGRVRQPGSFYRRWAVDRCGGVDPSYYLLMDLDLWIRLLRHGAAVRIPRVLAQFRVHANAKSSQPPYRYYRETMRIALAHERDRPVRAVLRRARIILVQHARYLAGRIAAAAGTATGGRAPVP